MTSDGESTAQAHWESVYQRKKETEVSWFRPHLETSLAFIEEAHLQPDAPIIDVGGGASTLVDDLLDRRFTNLTVLDISEQALEVAKRRLGSREALVQWKVADVTTIELQPNYYAFWHDRAVFHFLNTAEQRQRYVETARHALQPAGHIVVGTFGLAGPEQCSGLSVVRFSPDTLHAEFGEPFQKLRGVMENHATPWGTEQQFTYCFCKRTH